MALTQVQQEAISHEGDLLITGGPGSGKTTVGLLKAQAAIRKGLLPSQEILFLSFSNSAVYQITQAASIRLTTEERKKLAIHTFHSFFWEVLQSYGYLLGLPVRLEILAPELAIVARAGLNKTAWEEKQRLLAFDDGLVSFDLFAPLLRELLTGSTFLRRLLANCFPFVIVDEFQDTDEDQWQVLALMSVGATILALGDRDQRIHDYRPGMSVRRLDEFVEARSARCIEFSENHRSPGAEHIVYAKHVMDPSLGVFTCSSVQVSTYRFQTAVGPQLKRIIQRAENAVRTIKGGTEPISVLVVAATHQAVQDLSVRLTKRTEKANYSMRHELFSHTQIAVCGWHFIVALLNASGASPKTQLPIILRRLSDFHRCHEGSAAAQKRAHQLSEWAVIVEGGGTPPRASLVTQLNETLVSAGAVIWTGDIITDLHTLQTCLSHIQLKYARDAIEACNLWSPFKRGSAPRDAIEAFFQSTGTYRGSAEIFRRSLAQEQMADRYRPPQGRHLMTLHRCKGKEYDAVVIFDGQHGNGLVLRNDNEPYDRSRRLLRVAITRARHLVYILTPADSPCPLLPV